MTTKRIINISEDFSAVPAGRYYEDGPFSGQFFREKYLLPVMGCDRVIIVLDGAFGLPVSFLEEAFGGLVREGFSSATLNGKLGFVAETERVRRYPDMIWHFIRDAERKKVAV